ncbi:MAG: CCA tRNA nucleotidyltransferase [Chloroflexota bacterium]
MNLAARLESALSTRDLSVLRQIANEADARGLPLYLVGGFARDLVLGRPSLDFDLVLEGDALTFARACSKKLGGKLTVHKKFATATLSLPSLVLDFITARSETYSQPAALPDITPGALADDLRRRDFTINTLAVCLNRPRFGELRDDLGGLEDLQRGLVRVLHPRSFVDDPTRLYRAVRYAIRFGFKIAPETLALVEKGRRYVKELSGERIRHELDLILDEPNAAQMLAMLEELSLLDAIVPRLPELNTKSAEFFDVTPARELSVDFDRRVLRYILWLMDSPMPLLKSLSARLSFTADLSRAALAASALREDLAGLAGASPSRWTTRLEKVPPLAVYAVSLAADESARAALTSYLARWRHIQPKTTGETLKARGVRPGPSYKRILTRLRAAWLDGEVKSAAQESALLEVLLQNAA